MKSHLNFTPFKLGAPTMGGNVMPWLWKHVEWRMVTFLTTSGWSCGKLSAIHEGSNTQREKEVHPFETCNSMQLESNAWQ